MIHPIHNFGDPVLREKSHPVAEVNEDVRRLADEMLETMRNERGVGLAAQQIGKTLALCVVDVPPELDTDESGTRLNPDVPMPLVLINPEIEVVSDERESGEEGCLSFPGITAAIPRATEVVVAYTDEAGRPQRRPVSRFVARAVQHEIDHLNGVLFIDRMSHVKRVALSGKLKRLRRETQQALGLGR